MLFKTISVVIKIATEHRNDELRKVDEVMFTDNIATVSISPLVSSKWHLRVVEDWRSVGFPLCQCIFK